MGKTIQISKAQLQKLMENEQMENNYMFFGNLEQIERQCKLLRQIDPQKINELLNNGHDWADDHVSEAKVNLDQVFDFIMNATKGSGDDEHVGVDADLNQFSVNEAGRMRSGKKDPCWAGYEMVGTKMKNGKKVPNCVPRNESIVDKITSLVIESLKNSVIYEDEHGSVEMTDFVTSDMLEEAEYQGRKVQLGKIMQGDIKKFKTYVKNDKGKVVKVNFGFGGKSAHGKRMVIKKDNPERRKSFRARMNCDNPGPRWKPRYWSCRAW